MKWRWLGINKNKKNYAINKKWRNRKNNMKKN